LQDIEYTFVRQTLGTGEVREARGWRLRAGNRRPEHAAREEEAEKNCEAPRTEEPFPKDG
jgi:hypothetical protein